MAPVSQRRIQIAEEFGLKNVDQIAVTCREAGVPFFVACALFQKESGGRNVYGHDKGGALSGYPRTVNVHNFRVFHWMIFDRGMTSNGVGPAQITYKGFFTDMERQGLKPWDVHDNMLYGLRLLKGYYEATDSWEQAGTRYNGAASYGADLARKISEWRDRLSR